MILLTATSAWLDASVEEKVEALLKTDYEHWAFEAILESALAQFRAGLLSLPGDIGLEIAAIDDKNECVALINEIIHAAMISIAESNIAMIVNQDLQGNAQVDEDDLSSE